ncbi:MAG: isoprenylcysteine carboxylmethyltransferase family protein [Anaerolineales bacterium]
MILFLKNLLFTIIFPGSVAVYIPLLIVHGRSITSIPRLLGLGMLLLTIGAAIYLWTVWDFAISGKGTPLPIDAPKCLVVRGLYHYCRNPMYVGVLMVILGWGALFADGWLLVYACAVGVIVHLFVVFYEESRLLQLFGDEYESYRRTVDRWLPRAPKQMTPRP